MGPVFLQGPHPQALRSARPMDLAADLVATIQEMALSGLATAAGASTLRRAGPCAPDLPDPFLEPALLTRFCESWMRENRTSSLSGGRRPAFRRASSDPIPVRRGNRPEGPRGGKEAPGHETAGGIDARDTEPCYHLNETT